MAIAFVNKGSVATVDTGTSLTVSYAGAVAGNFLVHVIGVARHTTTVGTITLPSTWSSAVNGTSAANSGGYIVNSPIFYKPNIASGAHSAAHSGWPSLTAANGIIAEFSGLDTSTPLDTAVNNNQASTGTSGTTASSGVASQANVLWIAVLAAENGVNTSGFTSSIAGWTTLATLASDATGVAWWSGYQIAAVSTAVNPGVSWTNSSAWQGSVAGFKPAAGGAVRIFSQTSLNGLSIAGPKQFNPTLASYYRERAAEQRRFMNMVSR